MNSDINTPPSSLDLPTQRISRRYGFAQTIILICFACVSLLSPKDYIFDLPAVFLAGNALCAIGIIIMAPALVALRGTVQIAPEPKAGKQLVETGIYRYLRHPIYTGIVVCVVGLFLRQPSLWMVGGALIVIIFLAFKVRFEEKLLRSTYPGYAAYQKRSWGLFPGLRY